MVRRLEGHEGDVDGAVVVVDRRVMRCSRFLVLALALAPVLAAACDPPPAGDCPVCAVRAPACDNGCPAIADEVCVDGACVEPGEATIDLKVAVNLGRDLDGVVAVALAVIDARGGACADIGAVADADNVLAGNRIEVSGGTFHPDLPVGGLVPAVSVVVAVDALDASDAIVASGCVAAEASADADIIVDVPAL